MSYASTARLIEHCRHLARIFDEELPNTALDAPAHRRGGVNPYYNRTSSGLYLEFYYGFPSKIWTPGGYWSMTGSTSCLFGEVEELAARFMSRVDVRLTEAGSQSKWGYYGPVYAIVAIDGDPVEWAGAVIPYASDRYAEIKSEWAALAEGWDGKLSTAMRLENDR